MLIDLSNLTLEKLNKQAIDISLDKDYITFNGENIYFNKPIEIKGMFTQDGSIISLDGTLKTELRLSCVRCLVSFLYTMEIEIHEKLSNSPIDTDEDIIFIEGDKLDITDIIESNIILALPSKTLCKEDCKGICQHCGTNLNTSSCSCDKEVVDPRLAKLKDLFSTD